MCVYKSVCLSAGIKSVFTALSAPLNVPGIFNDGPFFFIIFILLVPNYFPNCLVVVVAVAAVSLLLAID